MINYTGTLCCNSEAVIKAGMDYTGEILLKLVSERMGIDLAQTNVLDIGCGVRFAQTIINKQIPIKSYTGIEARAELVDYLNTLNDPRFKFAHWNVRNELYNPDGEQMTLVSKLPVDGYFDVIWAFSVFTHVSPLDALLLLIILKRYGKRLFFTVNIGGEGFEDTGYLPLLKATYSRTCIERLIRLSGWSIESYHEPENFIQSYYILKQR